MEKFNIKQEQNIKNLEMEIQSLNEECKEKDVKYKQLDKTYLSIIHIIEKQKKNIRNLQDKLNQKQKDENNKIKIIQEKEQEIGILKGFINSLKNENALLNNSINNERRKNSLNSKRNVNNNSNASSRINSGISNKNNNRKNNNYNTVNQYKKQQQTLPMIKSTFSKNNNNVNTSNYSNNYNNNNYYMENNYINENLPMVNNINNIGNNSNNNSFQNINKGNNYNNLSNQFKDLEAHEEENFKQIDLLMRKIMSD